MKKTGDMISPTFLIRLAWAATLCCACIGGTAFADDPARSFMAGLSHYERGEYEAAVEKLLSVADSGIRNGKLFYNLGSAYLKAGDIGRAMLWYERALKLMPHDPDLKFNHAYTQTRLKDEKEETGFPVWRILVFWRYLFSAETIQWSGLILNLLFWSLLAVRLMLKKRRMIGLDGGLLLLFSLVLMLTAAYNAYNDAYRPQAVILPQKVSVRSGLSEDSTELFVLHAGTKVLVRKQQRDCFQILFSEDKIGWVRAGDIEQI